MQYFENELQLLESHELIRSTDALRTLAPVDLIVSGACCGSRAQPWHGAALAFSERCKASVLAVDPAADGSPLTAKWSILPMLPTPVSDRCGRVYLCDLGFTKAMFSSVDIKYESPFGAKFCIPLHND